jgi:hypothetical protein
METRAFAPLNLRATRQPQALKRHGCHAIVFSTCHSPKNLKKGGIMKFGLEIVVLVIYV